MLPHKAVESIEQQEWLDPGSETVQQAVKATFKAGGLAGQQAKNALHGTWLGHQLHPALTDVPIGAWTVALVLDALEARGRWEFAPGADAAIAVGLAGATGAAVTGITDWAETNGEARRVGATHGLLNLGVALLYGTSLAARRQGYRATGRQLAALGYAVSMVSAYLGGHLVFAKRIGVDHADVEAAPRDWIPVMAAADLPENQPRRVEVNGVPVLLVHQDGRLYALAETCSHLGGPLAEGTLEGCSVRCPWHGSRFALDDGRVLDGPATTPQPRFALRVREGQIDVRTWEQGESTEGVQQATSHTPASTPAQPSRSGAATMDQPAGPAAPDTARPH